MNIRGWRHRISTHIKDMARRQTPWYRKRPDLRGFNLSARDKHSAVSMEWGFTYIRIPKAANSTVGMTLDHHFPGSGRTDRVGRRAYRKLSRLNGDEARRVFEEHFIVETLQDDVPGILRRIAGDKDIRSDLVRAGPRPTKAAEKCRHYYDEEAFDIVRTLYGQDFERLEYDDSRF